MIKTSFDYDAHYGLVAAFVETWGIRMEGCELALLRSDKNPVLNCIYIVNVVKCSLF